VYSEVTKTLWCRLLLQKKSLLLQFDNKLTLVIRMKLKAAILGGGCSEEMFCRPSSTAPVSGKGRFWCGAFY